MSKHLMSLVVATIVLVLVSVAHAALTTGGCLAQKQKAWGNLRKCEAGEKAKLLQGKPGDLAKCETKLQDKLGKIDAKAVKAAIACRYGDNGDGTVTDYDTGLQWEQKTTVVGSGTNAGDPHDVDNTYSWSTFIKTDGTGFLDQLNGESSAGTSVAGCFAGHCDWRLPSITELPTILLEPNPCGTSPCIDPVFGPTVADGYWSATTLAGSPSVAFFFYFDFGPSADINNKGAPSYVRAVRTGL